ncbi:hypothetical protein ABW20_dc0107936 [Dactylellina cionopaga]|nr:hypothetical protein ABW20_dc0107936 [Dactylellina cionopaga]
MVCSILRLFVFYKIMVESFDQTWNATDVVFWSILESSLACIIASLPALNQPTIKILRRLCNRTPPDILSDRLQIIRSRPRKKHRKEDNRDGDLKLGGFSGTTGQGSYSGSELQLRRFSSGEPVENTKFSGKIVLGERLFIKERPLDLENAMTASQNSWDSLSMASPVGNRIIAAYSKESSSSRGSDFIAPD